MKRRDGNELTHHSFHSIRVTVLNKYLINKPRNFCTPGLIFASISNIDVIPNVSREYMKKQSSYIRTIISTCSSSIDEIVSRVPVLSWKSSNKSFSIIIERKREGNRRIDLRLPQIESYDFPDFRDCFRCYRPSVTLTESRKSIFDRRETAICLRSISVPPRKCPLTDRKSIHLPDSLWEGRENASVRAVFSISPRNDLTPSRSEFWRRKLKHGFISNLWPISRTYFKSSITKGIDIHAKVTMNLL